MNSVEMNEISKEVDESIRWLGEDRRDKIKVLCKYIPSKSERSLFLSSLSKARPQDVGGIIQNQISSLPPLSRLQFFAEVGPLQKGPSSPSSHPSSPSSSSSSPSSLSPSSSVGNSPFQSTSQVLREMGMRGPANVIDYQQSQTPSPSSSSLNPISFIQNLNQSYSAMERLGLIQSVVQSELKTRRDFSHVRVTPDQFDHFITNGYLVLPSCVDENVVNSALKLINLQLGKGVSSEKAEAYKVARGGLGYWPEIAHSHQILDLLYDSPAFSLASQLIGTAHPCRTGQIALRFPGDFCVMSGSTVGNMLGLSAGEWVPAPGYNTRWHIDGFNTVVEADTHSSASPSSSSSSSSSPVMQFTMLLGVLLSDVCDDFSGNLMVWPQSHIDIQNHINKTGDLHSVLSTSTGMDQSGQGVALRNGPVFLKGKRGDVIMAHWQLAHSVAPNMSPNVRYCVYFRLLHSLHPPNTFVRKVMENVWLEYDGVRQYMEMKEKK